ncbi:MAG: endonuclease [Pseudomonadota bacterium]
MPWKLFVIIALVIAVLIAGRERESLSPSQSGEASTYQETRPLFWKKVYPEGGKTLYCGKHFSRRHDKTINIEHVFPMSWVTKTLQCGDRRKCRRTSRRFNLIEADMHNMYPALAKVNKRRSAMAYDIINGEDHYYEECDFEVDLRKWRVEPAPAARGKIARAMLYMAGSYDLKLFPRQKKLLLKWHRNNPPSRDELARNQRIMKIQGKANPYITKP